MAKKIVIIGGGIGGAATAIALHRAGFEAIVYERKENLREAGAGIALWANATHVLKNLGVLSDVLRESDVVTNYQFNSKHGEELVNISLDHFEVPAVCIHRADLHTLLWRNLSSEQLVLGQTFEQFEQNEDKIIAHFSSGKTCEGDALIGADGLRSQVRAALFGDSQPIYRGFTTWRGLTDYIPSTYRPGYITEFIGSGGGFGFVTIGKGRMYWYAAAKRNHEQTDVGVEQKSQIQERFKDWHRSIPDLIAATDQANILKTDLYDRIPVRPWGKQNVTLLGDAAHPTLPTLGQGACMALEDALVITKCLLTHSDPAVAFQQYESQRFERTKAIVQQSLQAAQMGRFESSFAIALRETFMKLMKPAIQNSFKSLHAYRA
ncbi:FAD-dependent monooxygenase [Aetokthonos hydrillicola Thurmond2011]|jgi:2-polyprenyl-6-methoxyphenol hydroxylase-like FAD-dependent oxidoreductase|uniref:FAD-dependent monooxygenase n=1 Tax=Aetokthonos hydrillicola Thurmond2011 TaxID=2712845 RepID=A0AAP5IDW7_9CYAN|nr:FAD-dependent monooxygenase [Aetokthonos hydrillicola]MBO3462360.1 NAD(P)-binding protein [Aetokthonos hydrillicola CCALA 1050]MBW4584223.1 FAD-dependent monooxygenase [Aetokthonos hydrillicola CCALA 1050]MDR9898569.1 FAD-dependent monooxygenase [Aetokthonos hydrillicola Thurmond2011]